jgi:flagellar motor component MotA
MELREIINLSMPAITIAIGILLKTTNISQLYMLKKYWLIIIVIGIVSFFVKTYKYF